MVTLIDTNVFIYAALGVKRLKEESLRRLEAVREGAVHPAVAIEVFEVSSRLSDRATAASLLNRVLAQYPLRGGVGVEALQKAKELAAERSISIVDGLMLGEGSSIETFDRRLARIRKGASQG